MGTGDAADCIQSAIDCRVHFSTDSLQGVCHFLSDLLLQRHQVCCGGRTCLPLCDCCCCRGSRGPPNDSTCEGAQPRSATMTHMQLCFVATWSQRECVGRVIECTQQLCDKGNKCAGCNSVKPTCNRTLTLSLGQLCAQADCDNHCYGNKPQS